jgi:multicomponent Na+:H+ antiporter subunit B
MTWIPDFLLMTAALVAGFLALRVKDLLASVVALSTYSFLMALLFTALGAVDVGFMEAVVGAGVTGVLFVAALFVLGRRAKE